VTTRIKSSLGPVPVPVLALLAIFAVACADDPNALVGGRKGASTDGTDPAAAALQCTVKPEGRSYVLFDGSKLEATRVNEASAVNRARIKPYTVMANEYQRVLGVIPESVRTAASSFGNAPERWYTEPVHSGVSMNAVFDISFEACLSYVKTSADLTAAPTAQSAGAECTKLMRKAWNRSPSPEEISGCTDLAVTKLATSQWTARETDLTRRWAYVCASVLSSSQFLTF
jgi:hypothetical protein